MMKNVSLLPHQIDHVHRLMRILQHDTAVMDFSYMGLGKTYTSTELAVRLGLETLLVVCPVAMETKWREVASHHGIPNIIISSFAAIRSTASNTPKHGLLTRDSEKTLRVTDAYRKMVASGVMMVIDEVHNLKNNSEQFRACRLLTNVIHDECPVRKSRCILLSGTPVDKHDQSIRMLQLMGLYTQTEPTVLGLAEMMVKIQSKDPSVTKIIKNHPTRVAAERLLLCHVLFRDVVRPHWTSAMPSVAENIDCKNGYYTLAEKDQKILDYYIQQLHRGSEGGTLGSIVQSLEGIEQAKLPIFEKLVRQTLALNPHAKVCVGLHYVHRTLTKLAERLHDLHPVVLTGETSRTSRDTVVRQFQDPSPHCRLLLANIKCLSTGIDLDDKHGSFPRFVFASPNYNIVDLHQFSRRFVRVDSRSCPVFRFVYGDSDRRERSILNALARKTNILQEILVEQTNAGIKFPGEYEDEFVHDHSIPNAVS